jgi:hypothetical protein
MSGIPNTNQATPYLSFVAVLKNPTASVEEPNLDATSELQGIFPAGRRGCLSCYWCNEGCFMDEEVISKENQERLEGIFAKINSSVSMSTTNQVKHAGICLPTMISLANKQDGDSILLSGKKFRTTDFIGHTYGPIVWSGLFDFPERNPKFCQSVKAAAVEGKQPSPISAKTYTFLEPKKSKNGTWLSIYTRTGQSVVLTVTTMEQTAMTMNKETKTLAAITTMMVENRLVYSCYAKHHPFTGAQPIVFYEVSAMPNKKIITKEQATY